MLRTSSPTLCDPLIRLQPAWQNFQNLTYLEASRGILRCLSVFRRSDGVKTKKSSSSSSSDSPILLAPHNCSLPIATNRYAPHPAISPRDMAHVHRQENSVPQGRRESKHSGYEKDDAAGSSGDTKEASAAAGSVLRGPGDSRG